MPVEVAQFIGAMDLDSPEQVIAKGFHRTARNGVFRGMPGNMRFEVIPGTTLVPNPFLPNTGTNMCLNSSYDPVNKRIFVFNWNSTGLHGIYIYNTLTGIWQVLMQVGTNTVGDPLGFFPDNRITSVDIIYGDANAGDLLFYVDTQKRPTKINIQRYLAGTYTAIDRSYIDVIKAPPVMPPRVTYENDFNVAVNNMINALFKFAYTFIYDDNEESVLSSASIVALPSVSFDPTVNAPTWQNARESIYLQTGNPTVKKIRIYGKQTKDGATTDWFIVDTLIKADLSIQDNGIYRYLFFNSGNPVAADPKFTVLGQDFVPQQANCQALLDGTTIAYAGIVEGYDFINPSFSFTNGFLPPPIYTINGCLFFAAPNGTFTGSQPNIEVFLTGTGNNDGSGNPLGVANAPLNLFVRAKSNATNINFQVTGNASFGIPTILTELSTAATGAGWTVVTTKPNSIVIYYPTGNVVLQSSYVLGTIPNLSQVTQQLSLCPQAAYQWGVIYYTGAGQTNGVISNVTGQSTTAAYNPSSFIQPLVTVDLSGFTPPKWAVYYHLVRTDNLTYGKRFDWVSNQAFSDVGQSSSSQFAYIGISNIFDYNLSLGATEGVVSYGFSSGDRVRFLGVYNVGGSFTPLSFDYAVVGVVIDPVISGVTKIGTFVKIAYPTGDISSGFKFDGSADFQNYQILLYSYKGFNAANQNVFYESGLQFGIGNPGLNTAYHMGNIGDNFVSVSDGDLFYRQRVVPVGNTYFIDCGAFTQGTDFSSMQVNVPTAITTSEYDIRGCNHAAAGLDNSHYPTVVNNDYLIRNDSASAFSVRLRYTINVSSRDTNGGNFGMYAKVVDASNVTTVYNILPSSGDVMVGTPTAFTVDATIALKPTERLWPLGACTQAQLLSGFQLRLDIVKNVTIQIFEPSYSDIYNLVTNSDNRPNVIDTTALQTYFNTLFRFSQPYQLGTNINNTNRFYPNNFDEFTKEFGAVIRMYVWQRELRIFQERRCGRVGVFAKFIKNNTGANSLITSDTIITPNNIQYFEGNFGIGNQAASLVSSGFQNYFADPVRGAFLRLSLDGLIEISLNYKVQTFSATNVIPYLNPYHYQFGGFSNILGVFNITQDRDGEVLFVMQPGTKAQTMFVGPGSSTIIFPVANPPFLGPGTIPGQTLAFNEAKNAFTAFYDFAPDSVVCAENTLYSFLNGVMYVHNNQTAYAKFYNTQAFPSLTKIYNENTAIKKTFQASSYQAVTFWESPTVGDIFTSEINPQTGLIQQSALISQDYELMENVYYAALLRDANSQSNPTVALLEGDYLKGTWCSVKYTYRGSAFNFLFSPYLNYTISQRNM